MNVEFLKASEKKKLLYDLEEQFGITKLPYLLMETGKEKIRGFSGTMTKEEMKELSGIANVEIIGMYLVRKEHSLRLSLDATHILKEQISKNVVEINTEQLKDWFQGKDIQIVRTSGVCVIRHKDDFVGCGISNGERIINFVPKERRVRVS